MATDELRIPVRVGALTFKNPFYVASGPSARTVRQLVRIEETGWAAASIKLSIDPAPYINRKPRYGVFEQYRALGFTAEKRLSFAEGLKLIEEAKKVLKELILFANITYAGDDDYDARGWVNMAKGFEDRGADVIELNMCCPNMSYNVELTSGNAGAIEKKTGASLGQHAEIVSRIVGEIKKAIRIPLFVKLTPEGGQIAQVAGALYAAGADAVGGTGNRLGIPPINLDDPAASIYHLQKEISMTCYSGAWLKPLALRDTCEIRKVNGPGPVIMATGGIRDWRDAVEMILCGANLIGVCTETLMEGYDIVRPMIRGLGEYMDARQYRNLEDFCGSLVPEIKTAQEISLFEGYAEIIEPGLSAPCKSACPFHVPVQAAVRRLSAGDYEGAWKLFSSGGPLQGICDSVCEAPCESACARGHDGMAAGPVRIRPLKRFILDWGKEKGLKPDYARPGPNGKSAGIAGSGPAGLSAAFALARAGYAVTVYEKEPQFGGSLRYLAPAFILSQAETDALVDSLAGFGIDFKGGPEPGRDFTPQDLRKRHDVIILAAGKGPVLPGPAAAESTGGIPGNFPCPAEGLPDIADFMRSCAALSAAAGSSVPAAPAGAAAAAALSSRADAGRALLIGSSPLHAEAARCALRLGFGEVYLFCEKPEGAGRTGLSLSRGFAEAREEGVKILFGVRPAAFHAPEGKLRSVEFANCLLPDSRFTVDCDLAVLSLPRQTADIPSVPGVFSAKPGNSFIKTCMAGLRAAEAADAFVRGAGLRDPSSGRSIKTVKAAEVLKRRAYIEPAFSDPLRVYPRSLPPEQRLGKFEKPRLPLSAGDAEIEAGRCLNCGCGEGCMLCKRICCEFAPGLTGPDTLTIDREVCVACGMCFNRCPNKNIRMVSTGAEA
ncbi:MAG: NAD(P)-binding protein [Treponema sp.]|jgi:NADPH-dependent glutamate synthase beta subunit-like oxidoreductase/dihydroorotate dehydrogenase|nr:NAD(P)-binding protein [Treponema sp.]